MDHVADALARAIQTNIGDVPLAKAASRYHHGMLDATMDFKARCARLGITSQEWIDSLIQKGQRQAERLVRHCDSPIEGDVCPALIFADYEGFDAMPPTVHIPKEDADFPDTDIVIIPQFAVARYRIDFAIICRGPGTKPATKIVGLECDGADYHTDRQKDVARDAYLAKLGIEIFRASGTDIKREPRAIVGVISCVLQAWRRTLL
jgi:very-short-patch-repair endonuclease